MQGTTAGCHCRDGGKEVGKKLAALSKHGNPLWRHQEPKLP
jgi:hypothetical protein